MKKKRDMITGTVCTNKQGSDSQFDICTREEWNDMTEQEQSKALIEAMWESGAIDVFPNEN